jgi:hypothetical protein
MATVMAVPRFKKKAIRVCLVALRPVCLLTIIFSGIEIKLPLESASPKMLQAIVKGTILTDRERRTLSSLLIILCLVAGIVTGSTRVIDTSPPGPRELVWRVKSDTGVLFLMGSIHALAPSDYPLPARLQRTFQLADQYVFEVDLDEANGPLVQEFVSSRGVYSNGGSIRSVLAPAAYQKLQNLAAANNLTPPPSTRIGHGSFPRSWRTI